MCATFVLGINVYFCASVSWTLSWVFNCAFMEFHGSLELSSPMKYMLGGNCLLRGHQMYWSKIYETFMTHENPYLWLCKLFMVHENNWQRISWKFHDLTSTMKSESAVFMAMKNGSWVFQHIFMGFS